MDKIENTGQSIDFKKSYIVTLNVILLFDTYAEYLEKCQMITDLGEIPEGHELYFNFKTETFYTQANDTSNSLDA